MFSSDARDPRERIRTMLVTKGYPAYSDETQRIIQALHSHYGNGNYNDIGREIPNYGGVYNLSPQQTQQLVDYNQQLSNTINQQEAERIDRAVQQSEASAHSIRRANELMFAPKSETHNQLQEYLNRKKQTRNEEEKNPFQNFDYENAPSSESTEKFRLANRNARFMYDRLTGRGVSPEIARHETLQYLDSQSGRRILEDYETDYSSQLAPIVDRYLTDFPEGRLPPPSNESQPSIEPSASASAPSSSSSSAAAAQPQPGSSYSSSSSSLSPSSSSSSSSSSAPSTVSSPSVVIPSVAAPREDKDAEEERILREEAERRAPARPPARAPQQRQTSARPGGHSVTRSALETRLGSASAAAPPLQPQRREAPRQELPHAAAEPNFFERFNQGPERPFQGPYEGFNEASIYAPAEGTPEHQRHMDYIFGPSQGFASGGSVNAHGRFNMSPAEQAYIMQMQEQQAPRGYAAGDVQSPIQRGSMAAAHQVRSIPLSDKQRQRSLGKGLGSFLMNFSKSKQDSGLGMMAESMVPGSIAYGEGLEGYEAQNEARAHAEAELERKAQKDANESAYRKQKLGMEMLFHKERMGHQSSALAETKRYHDLLSGKTKEKENDFPSREELEANGFEVPKDAISLHDVKSKPLQKTYIDKAAKAIKSIEPMKENLRNLSRMDELLEDYPNLSTSFARVAVNNNKENPSYLKSILQGMANRDEVDAVNEYAKLSSDLLSNQIESFEGSKTISNMHKQILMKSMSDPGTSKEAAKLVNAKLKEKYARKLKYGELSEDGLSKGLVFKTSAINDEDGYSKDDRKSRAQSYIDSHPELEGASTEQIIRVMDKLGL